MADLLAPSIPGAKQLVEWFGGWPSFHDAEVLELSLRREGQSRLRLHVWRMTEEINAAGCFVLDRHAVVTFSFERVLDLELADFSTQNAIFGLGCEVSEKAVRVTLYPCYGIAGFLEAQRVSVSVEPGEPQRGSTHAPA